MRATIDDLLPEDAPGDLRRLVEYWVSRAAGRCMPAFEDIDPADLGWALPRLFVVRSLDDGGDFEYRVAGDERHGDRIVGRRAGELFQPGAAAVILRRWRRVVTEPAACFTRARHPTDRGVSLSGYRVVLPAGPADEGPADHMLGMTVYAETAMDPVPAVMHEVLDVRWATLRRSPGGEADGPCQFGQ